MNRIRGYMSITDALSACDTERALTLSPVRQAIWLHPRLHVPARGANQTPSLLSVAKWLSESKSQQWTTIAQSGIMFKDRTYIAFDVEPFLRITPDYSDWKTHNYKPLKRWPPLRSE